MSIKQEILGIILLFVIMTVVSDSIASHKGHINDRFIDNIQNQRIYELKIAENFNEFIGANVEDENMSFEDTAEIVDTYIDAVDTDLDKNKIKVEMRQLMTEAQALEIA